MEPLEIFWEVQYSGSQFCAKMYQDWYQDGLIQLLSAAMLSVRDIRCLNIVPIG